MTIMRIGVDLAKNVFDVHGVDEPRIQIISAPLLVKR